MKAPIASPHCLLPSHIHKHPPFSVPVSSPFLSLHPGTLSLGKLWPSCTLGNLKGLEEEISFPPVFYFPCYFFFLSSCKSSYPLHFPCCLLSFPVANLLPAPLSSARFIAYLHLLYSVIIHNRDPKWLTTFSSPSFYSHNNPVRRARLRMCNLSKVIQRASTAECEFKPRFPRSYYGSLTTVPAVEQ